MRQTVKNRMIKNVQMMAVGMMATASIMGTAAAMGVKMDNIPFNVLANPFQAVMTQGVAAIELGSSGSCGDNATYELSMDGTLTISGTGAIKKLAFLYGNNIKKVIINEGITEIGDQAFSDCQQLTQVEIPSSVTQIGSSAFLNCQSLKSITLPEFINQIEDETFFGCQKLTQIQIPSHVTQIGRSAFQNCQSLTSITLPENVGAIGNQAFSSCKQLNSINIPNGVEQIGNNALYGCSSLSQIQIPGSVTQIGSQAFYNCTGLEEVKISNGVTQIGDSAFAYCTSLREVNIPDTVTQMGREAFVSCKGLETVKLSKSLKTIESLSFKFCNALKEIEIPSKVQQIGESAFEQCFNLTTIQNMSGVSSIGYQAFGTGADYGYGTGKFLETTLKTNNEYVKSYDWKNWQGRSVIIEGYEEKLECGPDATYEEDDDKLTITGSGSIDDEAFKDKDTVTEVVIEEGITEIGDQSFENMDNLEKVTIPDSVTNIGDQAFAENPKLEIVQGGDNADIADNAFDCTEPETTIKTDNENIYNNIKDNTDRDVQLQNSVPISPVEENWLYSSDDEAFITDKVQVGSVKDDFESLLDEFATVVGLDEKQGAKQNYETADASDEDTLVYCTKASDWIITIPKDLVMSGDDESRAEYVVGIYGNVDPAKRVTVTPAPSFEMTNTGNAEVKYNAQVSQPVTGINGMDIIESPEADVGDASQMSGTITANLKRAGSYRGTMTFTVDYVDHT